MRVQGVIDVSRNIWLEQDNRKYGYIDVEMSFLFRFSSEFAFVVGDDIGFLVTLGQKWNFSWKFFSLLHGLNFRIVSSQIVNHFRFIFSCTPCL